MDESFWDFIRLVFTDPDLDNASLRQILEGLFETRGGEIQSEFIDLSDEEMRARVAEIYGLVIDLEDESLTTHATWVLQNCMNFREAEDLYLMYVFSNPLVSEDVLSLVVRTDPQFSIAELLVQLIKSNVCGSRQYTFERVKPYVRHPFVTPQVISSCVELARELGDEEGLGFLRKVFAEFHLEKTITPNITEATYKTLKEEECRQLAIYRIKLVELLKTENLLVGKMSKPKQNEWLRRLSAVSGMGDLEEGSMKSLLDEGLITPRQIRFLELLRWVELNDIFSRLYGPYNPPRIYGNSVFGPENPELPEFPDDPRRFFMLHNSPDNPDTRREETFEIDWFKPLCDFCHRQIAVRQRAFRTPLHEGGWEGCFCSATCSLKQLFSGMEYAIPLTTLDETLDLVRSQFELFFANSLGMGWVEGLGFIIREFPLIQYVESDVYTSHRRVRMPKIVVSPAREERVVDRTGDQFEEVLKMGEDILKQLGLDEEFLGDDSDPIRYVSEVILKREHVERYALTQLMNITTGSKPIVISPSSVQYSS